MMTRYSSAFIPLARTEDFICGKQERANTSFHCARTKGDIGALQTEEVCGGSMLSDEVKNL